MDGAGTEPAPAEANKPTPTPNGGGIRIENCYVFKSRLQEYALKSDLPTPEYHTIKSGPAHEPLFMSTVVINGNKYDSLPGFFTSKAAEQSAAEIALMEIVKSIPTNGAIPAIEESGLCKNLLQEYAQKMNYAIPSYTWKKQASGKALSCTVDIGGIQYTSAAGRSKKRAQIKVAGTALLAIHGQLDSHTNADTKFIVVPCKRKVRETEKKSTENPKPLKVNNGGFKKKWNKRKFMKKNGQAADMEKVQPKVSADVIIHMSPCSQQLSKGPSTEVVMLQPHEEAMRVKQEPPSLTAMQHPDVGVEQETSNVTAMLRPTEDARRVEQEPPRPSVTAMLQFGEEDRRAEQKPPKPSSDTALLQPTVEARRAEHEPSCDTVMLQTCEEARRVEQGPHRHNEIVMSNQQGGINQEPLSETVKSGTQ